MAKHELNLPPLYCGECGHLMIWTLTKSKAFCPKCKAWVSANDIEARKERVIHELAELGVYRGFGV